jgi:hypothetical protein
MNCTLVLLTSENIHISRVDSVTYFIDKYPGLLMNARLHLVLKIILYPVRNTSDALSWEIQESQSILTYDYRCARNQYLSRVQSNLGCTAQE